MNHDLEEAELTTDTCKRCDKPMSEGDWWCDEPICQSCYENIGDRAHDAMQDRDVP